MTGLPFVYANAAYKTLLCGQTRIIQALIRSLTAGAPAPGLCRIPLFQPVLGYGGEDGLHVVGQYVVATFH